LWKGSRHNYSDIEFVRWFHPPMRSCCDKENEYVLADYTYDDDGIRFFMSTWKKIYGIKETKLIRDECVRVLQHETTHGVIMHVLKTDRFTGSYNPEWPMNHGIDKERTKEYKHC
jgi:hypothetical protein